MHHYKSLHSLHLQNFKSVIFLSNQKSNNANERNSERQPFGWKSFLLQQSALMCYRQ